MLCCAQLGAALCDAVPCSAAVRQDARCPAVPCMGAEAARFWDFKQRRASQPTSHAAPLPPARRSRKRLDANGQQRPDSEMLEINVRPGWKAGTKITFQEKGECSCAIFCCVCLFCCCFCLGLNLLQPAAWTACRCRHVGCRAYCCWHQVCWASLCVQWVLLGSSTPHLGLALRRRREPGPHRSRHHLCAAREAAPGVPPRRQRPHLHPPVRSAAFHSTAQQPHGQQMR